MRKIFTYWKWILGTGLGFGLIVFIVLSKSSTGDIWVSLQKVKVDTVDVTVDTDGAVSSDQSVDLSSAVSGIIESISVEEGQTVKAGQLLMSLDSYEAGINVRNAALDVQSAQVKLAQLNDAASASDLKLAENALSQAKQDLSDVTTNYTQDKADQELVLQNAADDLQQERVNAYSVTAEAFALLPTTLTTVEDILEGRDYSSSQDNIDYYYDLAPQNSALKNQAEDLQDSFSEAENIYRNALENYQSADVNSDSETIVALLDTTYDAALTLSVLLKDADVFLLSLQDRYESNSSITEPTYLAAHITAVEDSIATLNPQLTQLTNEVQTLQNLEQDLTDAQRDLDNLDTNYTADLEQAELKVEAKQLALDDLNDGTDANDIKAQEIAVEKAQNQWNAAQKKYDDLFLRAPFSATVTAVNVDLGQAVSTATTAFTLVSAEKLVEVSLNEVDVSKVHVGDQGMATFDALPNISVPVTVAFISETNDTTTSVVEYKSHLTLNELVPDLKEGMSAHVQLTLNHVENVLVVPKTAVQTVDGKSVVEVLSGSVNGIEENTLVLRAGLNIIQKEVTVGAIGNDTVEIQAGLEEGEWVVGYSASTQTTGAQPLGEKPSGPFGEGAIDNGSKSSKDSTNP